MEKIQVYLKEKQLEKIEELVEEGHCESESEAVRTILTLKLDEAYKEIKSGPAGVGYRTP